LYGSFKKGKKLARIQLNPKKNIPEKVNSIDFVGLGIFVTKL
jgi:hypothetical protein